MMKQDIRVLILTILFDFKVNFVDEGPDENYDVQCSLKTFFFLISSKLKLNLQIFTQVGESKIHLSG